MPLRGQAAARLRVVMAFRLANRYVSSGRVLIRAR